jgi:hypothetical protein
MIAAENEIRQLLFGQLLALHVIFQNASDFWEPGNLQNHKSLCILTHHL